MSINPAGCTWKELVNLARKCGFYLHDGGKHTCIKDKNGKLITTIPRSTRMNKNTAEGILKRFKRAGCDIQ